MWRFDWQTALKGRLRGAPAPRICRGGNNRLLLLGRWERLDGSGQHSRKLIVKVKPRTKEEVLWECSHARPQVISGLSRFGSILSSVSPRSKANTVPARSLLSLAGKSHSPAASGTVRVVSTTLTSLHQPRSRLLRRRASGFGH